MRDQRPNRGFSLKGYIARIAIGVVQLKIDSLVNILKLESPLITLLSAALVSPEMAIRAFERIFGPTANSIGMYEGDTELEIIYNAGMIDGGS